MPPLPRHSLATLRRRSGAASAEPFACLTCYDASTARWLTRAGVHVLLVGDTAAETVFGFARTIDCPLEPLLALTAGVHRGSASAFDALDAPAGAHLPLIMGDMPFMSYQARVDDALRNAGRFLTDGLADVVKLEVDESLAPLVERMASAGIPVCAHVGARPQRSAITGYSAAGRTDDSARQVVADARAMVDAGAAMLLVEAVPDPVAQAVVAEARRPARPLPVIGIGAGPAPDGQVLVLHDLIGLTDRPPPFVAPLAHVGPDIEAAARRWVATVASRAVGPSPYTPRQPAATSRSG